MSEDERSAIAALAATVDGMAQRLEADRTLYENRHTKASDRLDRLERFMWLVAGITIANGLPELLRLL